MKIVVRSRHDAMNDARDVVLMCEYEDGMRGYIAPGLTIKRVDLGELIEPTFPAGGAVNGEEFLQAALNHAWEIGLRPIGFSDTTNQVTAIKNHLSDMRALVFKEIANPKTNP